MTNIVKVNIKHRYPWDSLTVDESFIIPPEIDGIKYHRQLVYAANKSYEKRDLENRFKSKKLEDGSVKVTRVM